MIWIDIKKSDTAKMPFKATDGSAGYDLFADIMCPITINPGDLKVISTGITLGMPKNCEAQIRSRSGYCIKYEIFVLNSPATIDSDYRGEIKVLLKNTGKEPCVIQKYDRIAQVVFNLLPEIEFREVNQLSETARGDRGFGSTGR